MFNFALNPPFCQTAVLVAQLFHQLKYNIPAPIKIIYFYHLKTLIISLFIYFLLIFEHAGAQRHTTQNHVPDQYKRFGS